MSAAIPISPTTPPTLYSENTSKVGDFVFTAITGSFTGSVMRVRYADDDGTAVTTAVELNSDDDAEFVDWTPGTGVLLLKLSPAHMATILDVITGEVVTFYVTLVEASPSTDTPLMAYGTARILLSAPEL